MTEIVFIDARDHMKIESLSRWEFAFSFSCLHTPPKMLTSSASRTLLQGAARLQCRQCRQFSASPMVAAGEVKKLGVIGAGQMVGKPVVRSSRS